MCNPLNLKAAPRYGIALAEGTYRCTAKTIDGSMCRFLCNRKPRDKPDPEIATESIPRFRELKAVALIVLLSVALWVAIWGVFLAAKWLLGSSNLDRHLGALAIQFLPLWG